MAKIISEIVLSKGKKFNSITEIGDSLPMDGHYSTDMGNLIQTLIVL